MKISQYILKNNEKKKYKNTMSSYIGKINTFEKRNKVNTIKWKPIYEVKDEAYFIGSKLFSDNFMQ